MSEEETVAPATTTAAEGLGIAKVGDDWLTLERGSTWIHDGEQVKVESVVSLERILVRKVTTGECVEVLRSTLMPPPRRQRTEEEVDRIEGADAVEIEDARRKEAALSPYLDGKPLIAREREEIATRFKVDIATVKRWLATFRRHRSFIAFLKRRPGTPRGNHQLSDPTEAIITAAIKETFERNDDVTVRQIWDRIESHCKAARLELPGKSTVQRRIRLYKANIRNLPVHLRKEAERDRQLVKGGLVVESPLSLVQIDHTVIDMPVICPVTGKSLGCPWITIVFDVHTRIVLGFCLTLECPSQLSTALALHHAVFPKEDWLKRIGASGPWPFYGIMKVILLDNASEFISEGFRRAALRWAIEVCYRQPGHPQHGGHIERFLGTLMTGIHALRGATRHRRFKKRLKVKSEFTLQALETWITNAIIAYHHELHRGLNMTPAQAWELAWSEPGGLTLPRYPRDDRDFLISFLPTVHRVVSREGIEWNGIHYRSDELQPYVERFRKQLFRFDPRDITRIYFDASGHHIDVPWTQWSFPKLSLWEWKELKPRLRLPAREIDSVTVHSALEANRDLLRQQSSRSEEARRRLAREEAWEGVLPEPNGARVAPLLPAVTSTNTALSFEILE